MLQYRVESSEISDVKEMEKIWLELQERADCSFFQSWGWIGTWLQQIAAELSPQVVTVSQGAETVGLGIFISKNVKRHYLINSQSLFLNEAPFDGKNMVIEYNGLLAANGCESVVYAHTLPFLLQSFPAVDEFFFGAMRSVNELEAAVKSNQQTVKYICQQESIARSVDLKKIGDNLDDYLASISKNRRLQIKRSLRLYDEISPVQINEAETIEQALQYFDGLKVLHTNRWQHSGRTGSFANSDWERFHRALISDCFDRGEIQLLRVNNGHGDIGYLYNFIWRNRVYVLQTGFAMTQDKRLMPGYVTHVLAVLHNKNKGLEVYDLMHGDDLYKKLLCNQEQMLYWAVVQRKRLKFALEETARSLLRKFR
ncbi:MAG: GNAT family N-acetyltransferase [Gammaproteobacteria bacterium]|nr:GNAT family N-acetyltransferase [Gammaproteobacteria bacterium]